MNPYLTDEVDIITVTHDLNGVESTSVQSGVKVRVSERHKLIVNVKGEEVFGSMHVMLEASASVTYESRLRIKKVCGVTYSMPAKEWQIHSISNAHNFGAHHIEAWV